MAASGDPLVDCVLRARWVTSMGVRLFPLGRLGKGHPRIIQQACDKILDVDDIAAFVADLCRGLPEITDTWPRRAPPQTPAPATGPA